MANSNYIDAHCHLADLRFTDLDRVLKKSVNAGVDTWVQGGVDPADWSRQIELTKKYPGKIITSFGLHPWHVAKLSPVDFEKELKLLMKMLPDADALGEIGLDYGPRIEAQFEASFPQKTNHRDRQKQGFARQLEILESVEKPLVLHIVRAHEDASSILMQMGPFSRGGIVHSFSGNREAAKKYLDLGLSLSISGGIGRKGFETLKRAVSYIPLDQLMVETDSPDQAMPGPEEDETDRLNEPAALIEIARVIASFRTETPEQILEASARNVKRIFKGV